MNTAQLKEYLEKAVALEKLHFYQQWVMLQWEEEIASLGIERIVKGQPAPPSPPVNPLPGMLKRMMISFVLVVAVMTGISAFLFGPTIWGAANMLGGVLLGLVVVALEYSDAKKDIKKWTTPKTRQEIFDRYEEEKLDYQGQLLARPQRNVLITARREVLQETLAEEKEKHAQTTAALEALYEEDVIFPKYRRLLLICSLYEYIQSGRCDKLEGPDGAYALLETEIQQKKIVADLGDLDWKEARIMQYGAYNAFQEIKEQAVAMSLELDRRVAERCRQKQKEAPAP